MNNSFNTIVGAVVDAAGDVIVVDYGKGNVLEIKPTGGYYINTPLPAGLSFSNSTGAISGTPTVTAQAKYYIVTAYNGVTNTNSATVNIKVNAFPLPTISYTSPQSYTVGLSISPLAPVSSGVATAAYGSPVTIGSGLSNPLGVATDAQGNVYVADAGNHDVIERYLQEAAQQSLWALDSLSLTG